MSNVNHPQHYNQGKIEVIEFLEDKELGFHLGNAVKYIARAGKKNPDKYVEDLEKAIWYLRRKLELQKEEPRRPNDMNPTSGSITLTAGQLKEITDIALTEGEAVGYKKAKDEMNITRPQKSSTKPSPLPKLTENNKEMIEKFLGGKSLPLQEISLINSQMKKEIYESGVKAGFDSAFKGKKPIFDPKIHIDNSFYGYGSKSSFITLNTPEGRMSVVRDRNKWVENKDIVFYKITPIGEVKK